MAIDSAIAALGGSRGTITIWKIINSQTVDSFPFDENVRAGFRSNRPISRIGKEISLSWNFIYYNSSERRIRKKRIKKRISLDDEATTIIQRWSKIRVNEDFDWIRKEIYRPNNPWYKNTCQDPYRQFHNFEGTRNRIRRYDSSRFQDSAKIHLRVSRASIKVAVYYKFSTRCSEEYQIYAR